MDSCNYLRISLAFSLSVVTIIAKSGMLVFVTGDRANGIDVDAGVKKLRYIGLSCFMWTSLLNIKLLTVFCKCLLNCEV